MLTALKQNNPDFTVYAVDSEEFRPFGRIISDMDPTAIIEAAEKIEFPESGASYRPSVEAFEALPIAEQIRDAGFGTLPTQVGYCWGY
ncbi:MAG: DUF4867 family protein, partial [Clostridia bacterium]|nr:DUF4867 family protein [Clostridia bacterium]